VIYFQISMVKKAIGLCLAAMVLLALSGVQISRAQANNRVALVVQFGDGSTVTRCVEFGEAEISGHDALARSGLAIEADYTNLGAAICKIEGTGCPASECLTCAAPSYWSYWHLKDSGWIYAPQGSSNYALHDGDVEGWRWGTGDPPPVIAFDQVCAPPPPPTDVPPPPTATSETAPPPPTATSEAAPPTAMPAQPTPVVWFRLDQNPIPAGACTAVRWDTSGASELYLDGQRVDVIGSLEACPSAPQEYHLRVVSATGEQVHSLVLGVTGEAPTSTPLPPSATPLPATATSPLPTATRPPATATPPPPTATRLPATPTSPPPTATRLPATPTPPPLTATRPPATPTVRPPATAAPLPSPSAVAAAIVPASSTPQAISSSPAVSPGGARPHAAASQPSTPWGYLAFGLIALGLTGWLAWGTLRRK
jgi:hypothetical protein